MEIHQEFAASLRMELDAKGLNYRKSSDFQGVMFRFIDSAYATMLHEKNLHPYSQYFVYEEDVPVWYVNTLNKEAYEEIMLPLVERLEEFHIRNGHIDGKVVEKQVKKRFYKDMTEDFYEKDCGKELGLQLRTFTSFKQKGKYVFLPDHRLIFQSLMMKYGMIAGNSNEIPENILSELVDNSFISRYDLRTGSFPLEGKSVPGYLGNMTIQIPGEQPIRRYARMLLEFGEFSGVGIKTGIGMGAQQLQ